MLLQLCIKVFQSFLQISESIDLQSFDVIRGARRTVASDLMSPGVQELQDEKRKIRQTYAFDSPTDQFGDRKPAI